MSLIDPIRAELWERGEKRKGGKVTRSYILVRGRETFYDADRKLREWDTQEQAEQWAQDHLPQNQIIPQQLTFFDLSDKEGDK